MTVRDGQLIPAPDRKRIVVLVGRIRADLSTQNKLSVERYRDEYEIGRIIASHNPDATTGRPRKRSSRDVFFRELKALGVSRTEWNRWRLLAEIPEHVFNAMLDKMADRADDAARHGHEITRASLLETGRDYRDRRLRDKYMTSSTATSDQIVVADVFDGLNHIPDSSVDVIITDPPYGRDDLPQFSALAQLAARLLVPAGLVVAVAGNSFLAAKMAALDEHLQWHWSMTWHLPRPQKHPTGGNTVHHVQGLPILVYSSGPSDRGFSNNVIHAEQLCDPTFHEHGLCPEGARQLVELVSRPGELVLDCFCGGGTILQACQATGRRYAGSDRDPAAIAATKFRLGVEDS